MKNSWFLLFVLYFGAATANGLDVDDDQHVRTSFLQSVYQSGSKVVVVGDRGVVGVSNNFGSSFKRSASAGSELMLNSVYFIDNKTGWAVGHGSSIMRTDDGGLTWRLQYQDLTKDRPLFGVYFLNSKIGIAVGLWSLVLRTEDGGATWNAISRSSFGGDETFDLNLYAIFGDGRNLYVAGEQGFVALSRDGGLVWETMQVDYVGTFWTGGVNSMGEVFVAGLRGSIYMHSPSLAGWVRLDSGSKASVTDVKFHNGDAYFSALDGVSLRLRHGKRTFETQVRPSRVPLTGVFMGEGNRPLYISKKGVVE